jgi:hypothetical protein
MHESIWQDLTTRFAPYLEQYPGVSIVYRGDPLNPAGLRDRTDTSTIRLEGTNVEAVLNIIEWKVKVDRRLYLCDENGFALADVPPGVQAPDTSSRLIYGGPAFRRSATTSSWRRWTLVSSAS